ncbi:TPA: GHKL domain-containing protein [Clostridioides difficile]|nr:sensor histidine kinase [Clostridioides difficile]HBF2355543.1 GHKL domain-containing protein [Clostridioides difficile]HBF2376484.1 GHKL domain-containing protein [Clostridioides difficile]HBF2930057.1 GHKL domain-containing protein [Clostridioides difficile]HBF3676232.1 GHKL domain-containing protein [Clostridioides difficile]HBF4063796.1 GHKL domain-containing protein [Clostridioides difficile]
MALFMSLLSAWILREYLSTFLEERKTSWWTRARWGFFVLWQVCSILGIIRLPDYGILVISVAAVLLVSFNYEGGLFKKIVFTVVYNSIWMLIEILLVFVFIAIGFDYAAQEMLGSLISKLLLLLLVVSLKRFFGNEKIRALPHSYNMMLVLIPLGSMFVVYTSFLMGAGSYKTSHVYWSFSALVIMLLINALIFSIYLRLSEDLELRQKNVVYKQEIDLYSKHIEEKENAMLEFRKARHDLKNQLIYLLERCEKKEYKELEQFLEQLIESAPYDSLTIAKTDNSVVDALVNYKYSIAKRFGIEFTVKLEIPMRLPFDNADMCIILGNALDNALEANIRASIKKRYIKLKMRMDIQNLVIVVENSFDGQINKDKKGKILTVKTNKLDHGLGLDSIQTAVNKYHGFMKTSYTENVFVLEIVLYNE